MLSPERCPGLEEVGLEEVGLEEVGPEEVGPEEVGLEEVEPEEVHDWRKCKSGGSARAEGGRAE